MSPLARRIAAAALVGCLVAGCASSARPLPREVSLPRAPTPPPPRLPDAAQERAVAEVARAEGRVDDALDHFTRAIVADPDAIDARLELAAYLLEQGRDVRRAALLVDDAERLAPGDPRVARLRGSLCELGNDDRCAAEAYARVLAVSPDPELRLRQGQLLARIGRTDEAVRELEEVARLRPSDRAARAGLAELYERQGRLREAERVLLDVAALAALEPGPQRHLAEFYRRHGAPTKAAAAEARSRALQGSPRVLRPLWPSKR